MDALSTAEYACLTSKQQRVRLYLGVFQQYQFQVQTTLKDAGIDTSSTKRHKRGNTNADNIAYWQLDTGYDMDDLVQYQGQTYHALKDVPKSRDLTPPNDTEYWGAGTGDDEDKAKDEEVLQLATSFPVNKWQPVVNIGPNRLAFCDEPIRFNPGLSYQSPIVDANSEGYGSNSEVNGTWSFEGSPKIAWKGSAQERADVTWRNPGLYQATYTVGNESYTRWVRVLQDRDATDWLIDGIGSVSGSWGAGWTMSLSVRPNLDKYGVSATTMYPKVKDENRSFLDDTDYLSYRCIGLFAEDQWWVGDSTGNGGRWKTKVIGNDPVEPRCVMIGYIKENSVQVNATTKQVQMTVETIDAQMARSQTFMIDCYGKMSTSDADAKYRGVIFEGTNRTIRTTDAALYLLQQRSDVLRYHDFYAYWGDVNHMAQTRNVTGQEGPIWGNLQSFCKNDHLVCGCTNTNAIYFAPDRQITKGWESVWPVRGTIDASIAIQFQLVEQNQRAVKWAKATATDTITGVQVWASYPSDNPPTDRGGNWVQESILMDLPDPYRAPKALKNLAENLYWFNNLVWQGSITLPLNRAFKPGDYVNVAYTQKNEGAVNWSINRLTGSPDSRRFLVTSVSYQIQAAQGQWQTNLGLQEALP